jgi:hypothetical protein
VAFLTSLHIGYRLIGPRITIGYSCAGNIIVQVYVVYRFSVEFAVGDIRVDLSV